MKVRDLPCWPPQWRPVAGGTGEVGRGERGVLIAARWDYQRPSLSLIMEEGGDRHVADLQDKVRVLSKLSLLLDWHIGRPFARIGDLEIVL